MCLLVLALEAHPRHRLVVAANRDELFAREAEPAHAWAGGRIVAGRDRQAGGTWLGITRDGRFAALTNYRDPRDLRPKAPGEPSRGELVERFLEGDEAPLAYARQVEAEGPRYRGFNLLVGDARGLAYVSNRGADARAVPPGLHGLSNHLLDTPWPKVRKGLAALEEELRADDVSLDRLAARLKDEAPAADAELPDTGVGLDLERRLSPMFIRTSAYGTRCTTVLVVERDGATRLLERTHDAGHEGEVRFQLP